jgi:hypothetical protein
MASDQPRELPPDANLEDFDYLAMSLEAEIVADAAYGYVSLNAIRFYLDQMRRAYQQALVGQQVLQLTLPEQADEQ